MPRLTARPTETRIFAESVADQQNNNSDNDNDDSQTSLSDSLTVNNALPKLLSNFQISDINAVINNGLVFGVLLAVLAKLSLVDQGMTRGWTAAEMAVRIPVDNWADYYQVLTNSPIQTKAATSATVYTIGDIIAQRTEGTSMADLDRPRVLRSFLAGALGHGPLSHYWYDMSEGFFNDYLHWTEWWSFFPKVILDQATWGPFWNNVYIIMLGLMQRQSLETIWGDIKRTTVPLVVSGLKLWPLAHCVTYGLVPVENRLLWVDLVEIIWVTILATQAAGGGAAATATNTESGDELVVVAAATEQLMDNTIETETLDSTAVGIVSGGGDENQEER